MKNFLTKIKNATGSVYDKLFAKPQQAQQTEEQQMENEVHAYLRSQNIDITKKEVIDKLLVELTWRKALSLKNAYAIERRKNFQPKLVIQERAHYQKLIQDVQLQIEAFYNKVFTYNSNLVLKQLSEKVLEEQCIKILFSKDEIRDHLLFFQNQQQLIQQLHSEFTIMNLEYNKAEVKLIEKQYLIDCAFMNSQIDDCDERKAVSLFQDDPDVLNWYYAKCNNCK